jgi:broad specificity phosphatase PhoE
MNKAGLLQGRIDVPLSDEGVKQAEDAAAKLRHIQFDRVFSSPLIRAVRTAEIVAPGIEPILDDRLLEMDYGPYEGMDLRAPAPEIMAFFRDFAHTPAPEGVEQLSEVVARAGRFLADVETEGDVLISTHAIAMKGFLEFLTPESRGSYWSKNIPNCAVYVTEFRDGAFTVPAEFI